MYRIKRASAVSPPFLHLFYLVVVFSAAAASAGISDLSLKDAALVTRLVAAQDTTGGQEACEIELDQFTTRQYRTISVHKAFAFSTAGLLLAADGVGLYHFLHMQQQGHDLRDQIGFTKETTGKAPQTNGVREVWQDQPSQTERTIHTGLIILGSLAYTATATIELTMPRTSKSTSPTSSTNIHRNLFIVHAGLMAANIALGLIESNALSQGNHTLVQGVGIAHLAVGFALPVVMLGAGLAFNLPVEY